MRSLRAWLSGTHLIWLVAGGILANLAGYAAAARNAPGAVWHLEAVTLIGPVVGVVWILGLILLGPRIIRYLGVGDRARAQITASAVAVCGLLLMGAIRGALDASVLSGLPGGMLLLYPRSLWLVISLSLLSVGLIEVGREVRRLRFERDNLQSVLAFSESVSLMGKEGVMQETVNVIRELTVADACLLFLLDPEADLLRVAAHYHNEAYYAPDYVERMINFPCPRGYGLTGRVLETGEPYLSSSVERDPRAQRPPGERPEDKTILILPMKVQGKLIGVIRVSKIGPDQFSEAMVTVCSILANHAAVAMDAGNLYHEVLKASRTDHLTGLGNARAFREAMQQAVVAQEPFALLMVDADALKRVNDTFGHQAGDELLIGVGQHLRAGAEGVGTPYRYAGDEFLVLLPELDRAEAWAVAERIRKGLAEMYMVTEAGSVCSTVSIGVAGFPSDGTEAEAVLRAADKAMYAAKQGGKNQVRVAS